MSLILEAKLGKDAYESLETKWLMVKGKEIWLVSCKWKIDLVAQKRFYDPAKHLTWNLLKKKVNGF